MQKMTTQQNGSSRVAASIFFSIAFVIAFYMLSDAIEYIQSSKETILVKGYAEKNIVSDYGSWSAGIHSSSSNLADAYSLLESNADRVIAYLKSKGFTDKQINLGSVETEYEYSYNKEGYQSQRKVGYKLWRVVKVNSENVNLIEETSRNITELIKEGIEINSHNPSFSYSKINDIKLEMLSTATKDAYKRAKQLAESGGSQVGRLRSAQQGVFQITPIGSSEISDYGMYDESTIHKTVKAVVTVEYGVK